MDPLAKLWRDLKEKLEQVEEQLLNGGCTTYDMYQAQVYLRTTLETLIADIKDEYPNVDTQSPEETEPDAQRNDTDA